MQRNIFITIITIIKIIIKDSTNIVQTVDILEGVCKNAIIVVINVLCRVSECQA